MIAASSALLNPSTTSWRRREVASEVSPALLPRVCRALREVEELLDWLEANGHPATEVTCTDDGFVVW
jgi:hypothetical protein